jgi:peptide/nickel transport system substrate-binding protein
MAKKKYILILISLVLALSLVLASCGGGEEEPVTEETVTEEPVTEEPVTEEPVTPTEGGNWWDKFGEPQYGGKITLRATSDMNSFDPYFGGADHTIWIETLVRYPWELDREILDLQTMFIPVDTWGGLLAESWEQPDLQTVIFHIRNGVFFHDKPPVNGRELTAYDVEYSYHRRLGLGSGFDEPSPYVGVASFVSCESITATDKNTVVFKWKAPSLDMLEALLDVDANGGIVPHEAIEQWGDMNDWEHTIGTGPYIPLDYVTATSSSFTKNTNYWGYDERYPENKLPYADTVKYLIIPDDSTAYSALRTGKIDLLTGISWEQSGNIMRTNPDLEIVSYPAGSESIDYRCDREPYTDVRVRAALQMAVDVETIAETLFGGQVDPTPYGLVGWRLKGYYIPFDEWPQELKEEYTYNPEGAKKLLAEAGYPNGFKTNCITSSRGNLDLLQAIQAYLADIGVDMEIKVMEHTVFRSFLKSDERDAMANAGPYGSIGLSMQLNRVLGRRYSKQGSNSTFNNDSYYDELYGKFTTSLDMEERREIMIEADMYSVEKHWSLNLFPTVNYNIYQPWFKGYSGEVLIHGRGFIFARWWIDQDLKK